MVMFVMLIYLPASMMTTTQVGNHGFEFAANHTKSYEDAPEHTNLMFLLIHLWLGDWHAQI